MCGGGGGGSSSEQQQAIADQQTAAQQAASAASLAEQQREFDATQQQNQQALANQQALQAQQQAQVDQQAALTDQWQTGRSAEQADATQSVNDAFASFTPDYYKNYTQAYTDHYQPQVDSQFAAADNNTTYGLARSGNLASQTAADQYQSLAQQKGVAEDDINNAAIGATTTLQNSTLAAKQNLLSQATSDATLGSPITPGSADAISADFNNTSNAIAGIKNSAGDTVTTLQATPQYSSLGTLFGAAASGATAAQTGVNNYNLGQAFNSGNTGGAASLAATSGKVT